MFANYKDASVRLVTTKTFEQLYLLNVPQRYAIGKQGVLFRAGAKSSSGDLKQRSDKSEDRNSGEFTQGMRAKIVVRLGRY